ncbi:hypothetical protein, partial [Methanoculleus sp. UBA303]|uniref:hypothetical protein n=1 Tax=Methanoculleus sp. UBA303 TaxID=1915497 RepID=UPI0025EAAE21
MLASGQLTLPNLLADPDPDPLMPAASGDINLGKNARGDLVGTGLNLAAPIPLRRWCFMPMVPILWTVVPYETTGHLRSHPGVPACMQSGARLSLGYRHDCP